MDSWPFLCSYCCQARISTFRRKCSFPWNFAELPHSCQTMNSFQFGDYMSIPLAPSRGQRNTICWAQPCSEREWTHLVLVLWPFLQHYPRCIIYIFSCRRSEQWTKRLQPCRTCRTFWPFFSYFITILITVVFCLKKKTSTVEKWYPACCSFVVLSLCCCTIHDPTKNRHMNISGDE